MEIAASEQQVSEPSYDCVICGQSGPSTEDRPIGLVVLLQATSGKFPVLYIAVQLANDSVCVCFFFFSGHKSFY